MEIPGLDADVIFGEEKPVDWRKELPNTETDDNDELSPEELKAVWEMIGMEPPVEEKEDIEIPKVNASPFKKSLPTYVLSPRSYEFFSFVGSYDGAVKIDGKWVRAVELNRIDKRGWIRRSGPPSPAIVRAVKEQPPTQATDLFPDLATHPKL